jgi:isopenicillin N synthase-like dioxygenase
MMTRGRFHSVPHRAVVNKSKPRLSIGSFLFLNQTMEVVSPTDLPVPAAEEEPDTRPEYRPFTFAELLAHKLSTQPLRTFEFFKVQHKSLVPTS